MPPRGLVFVGGWHLHQGNFSHGGERQSSSRSVQAHGFCTGEGVGKKHVSLLALSRGELRGYSERERGELEEAERPALVCCLLHTAALTLQ